MMGVFYSKAIALTHSGEIFPLSERSDPIISISPDDRWLVVYNEYGIDLLDENDQLIRTVDALHVSGTSLMWRPDSAGFYFASGSSIDYVVVPDGEPMRVDICPNGDCYLYYHQFVWLP